MLSKLSIKNIALIDALNVDFSGGMNVMTGETGAGKSIIVDAMNLALGERADREMIRTGQQKASVEAWFTNIKPEVEAILTEQQIDIEGELVLSREISTSGKNVCRVGGVLTTLGVLKQISDLLVDIHGQHEHQSLLHERNHMDMLDSFDWRILDLRSQVAQAYGEYAAVKKRLHSMFGDEGDRERRIDVLQFQIEEIRQAGIIEGEEEDLLAQKKRMNAMESIMDALSVSYDKLYDAENGSVLGALKAVSEKLSGIADVHESYQQLAGRVDEAYYVLEEVADTVRAEMDDTYFDADTLEQIEERLALISSLRRKYGDPLVTGEYLQNAECELVELIDGEALIEKLTAELNAKKQALYKLSTALSQRRRETAQVFTQRITEQLADLGMSAAAFSVNFSDIQPMETCTFNKNGIDTIAFYISTNRGEPMKPLKKIASGGEVSRIMLALKTIAAANDGIPTLIFDEIDTGISGRMAQVVGEKLGAISKNRQVICVTHLPQIASAGDKHFLIEKKSDKTSTTTSLSHLTGEDRVREVARLAGGESSASLQHAREMIGSAKA